MICAEGRGLLGGLGRKNGDETDDQTVKPMKVKERCRFIFTKNIPWRLRMVLNTS